MLETPTQQLSYDCQFRLKLRVSLISQKITELVEVNWNYDDDCENPVHKPTV